MLLDQRFKKEADCCTICAWYDGWWSETKLTLCVRACRMGPERTVTSLSSSSCLLRVPNCKNAVEGRNTHGCARNSTLIAGSAGQQQEMSVPEISPVVGEQWTMKGIVIFTTVSLARQQLAHNSYVSTNWHFKRAYCFDLESADEGTVTLWNVQNIINLL